MALNAVLTLFKIRYPVDMIEFPFDQLPANEDKAARERRIFHTFAAYASRAFGLDVIPGTIESREPPEPDILCEIPGPGPIAFELGEILDEEAMKAMSTMMSARDALLAHRATLPFHDQIALHRRFATREVRIAFRRDKALRTLQAVIPEIYRWLLRDVPMTSTAIPCHPRADYRTRSSMCRSRLPDHRSSTSPSALAS
jgi:hypothetical protein